MYKFVGIRLDVFFVFEKSLLYSSPCRFIEGWWLRMSIRVKQNFMNLQVSYNIFLYLTKASDHFSEVIAYRVICKVILSRFCRENFLKGRPIIWIKPT